MIGSNASQKEIDLLVRDMRLMLVGSAYTRWAVVCAEDNNNPFIPIQLSFSRLVANSFARMGLCSTTRMNEWPFFCFCCLVCLFPSL